MADIFISYKREDEEEHGRVKPIADALKAEGYDVFYDVYVPPGSKWEDVLEGKIASARAVLVLWSETSVESDWVKEEAEMAKAAGKLIPVMLDPVSPPFGFARIESAFLADWDGDLTHVEWKNLVAAVKARIGDGERPIEPGVTAVAYPRKTVTVTKTTGTGSGGGGGSRGWLIGISVIALAAVGGLAVFMMQGGDGSAPQASTGEAVEAAADAMDETDPPVADTQVQPQPTRPETPTEEAVLPDGTYRLGGLTIGNLAFLPARGSTVAPSDRIEVRYSYSALDNDSGYRLSITPNVRGTGCSGAGAGSEIIEGRGSGRTRFAVVGETCTRGEITGVTLAVRDEFTGRDYREELPITFSVEGEQAGLNRPFPGEEDCLSYTGGISMAEQSGRWQVRSGNSLITTVASRDEARTILRLLTEYGLTQQCFVGRPNPGLSYWKARGGGLPSRTDVADPDCLPVRGDQLSVRVRGGMSLVMDGARSMLRFREREKAENAVAIMQHYGATEICYVGRPGPSITYLKR